MPLSKGTGVLDRTRSLSLRSVNTSHQLERYPDGPLERRDKNVYIPQRKLNQNKGQGLARRKAKLRRSHTLQVHWKTIIFASLGPESIVSDAANDSPLENSWYPGFSTTSGLFLSIFYKCFLLECP